MLSGERMRYERPGLRLEWDTREAVLFVEQSATLRAEDAYATQDVVNGWTDRHPRFSILVDMTHAQTSAEWRRAWMGWFAQHKERIRIAVYGMPAIDRAVVSVFALMTGADLRVFDDAAAAREWAGRSEGG